MKGNYMSEFSGIIGILTAKKNCSIGECILEHEQELYKKAYVDDINKIYSDILKRCWKAQIKEQIERFNHIQLKKGETVAILCLRSLDGYIEFFEVSCCEHDYNKHTAVKIDSIISKKKKCDIEFTSHWFIMP
jgi:hypothetical protein